MVSSDELAARSAPAGAWRSRAQPVGTVAPPQQRPAGVRLAESGIMLYIVPRRNGAALGRRQGYAAPMASGACARVGAIRVHGFREHHRCVALRRAYEVS